MVALTLTTLVIRISNLESESGAVYHRGGVVAPKPPEYQIYALNTIQATECGGLPKPPYLNC